MKVIYNGEYKLKRAVITGPTGAIGTALIQCLSHNGVQVVAVVTTRAAGPQELTQDLRTTETAHSSLNP